MHVKTHHSKLETISMFQLRIHTHALATLPQNEGNVIMDAKLRMQHSATSQNANQTEAQYNQTKITCTHIHFVFC